MKKWFSILLAVVMMGVVACAAFADEVPEPEGGKKFGSNWAVPGGYAMIVYEEEGYKVMIDVLKDGAGAIWEYSCYYMEDTDSLKSVSSTRTDYTYDPDTNEKTFKDPAYEGLDEENQTTEFAIDQDGFLIWKDGREDAGAGLKFTNIGDFEGVWKDATGSFRAEIRWNGATEDEMFYTVFITRGDSERYDEFVMNAFYDAPIGKLSAMGTRTEFTKNESGEYDTKEDGENYEALFSKTADGKVLLEPENVELEYSENWTD